MGSIRGPCPRAAWGQSPSWHKWAEVQAAGGCGGRWEVRDALLIWAVLGLHSMRGLKESLWNINGEPSSLPAAHDDASPQAPPRLGELWVTDPTPDSLRLSWTVPEGHFDSFVVQFKDRDGPRMVPVGGHERSVTIIPLDSGRTYRFLLYGLLGKRRHGPLSTDGTTGEAAAAALAAEKVPGSLQAGLPLLVLLLPSPL